MDKENDRLRLLLEKARQEGKILKARVDEEVVVPTAKSPLLSRSDKANSLSMFTATLDDVDASTEDAPSYAELMAFAAEQLPPAVDAEEIDSSASAAAKIAMENIRSQAKSFAADQPVADDRIERILKKVSCCHAPPSPPRNERAAEAARARIAAMRAEAHEYARLRAKERQARDQT